MRFVVATPLRENATGGWEIWMKQYQSRFLELAMQANALAFGEFTLKSGRISPYFFNAGNFSDGEAISALARCYADAIIDLDIPFDVLFGPAYKGIPLVAATAAALYQHHGRNAPFTFNRKEAKTHGEGGQLVGAKLSGRVLILDDVITAGTAIRESIELIDQQPEAAASAVLVALDRGETGPDGGDSAVETVRKTHKIDVFSVVSLEHLLDYLSKPMAGGLAGEYPRLRDYWEQYGSKTSKQ